MKPIAAIIFGAHVVGVTTAAAECIPPSPTTDSVASLPEQVRDYPFTGRGVFAQSVLRAFAEDLEIGIFIDPTVEDVQIDLPNQAYTRFLFIEAVARAADLAWYFDGAVLQILPVSAIETKVIALESLLARDGIAALQELGIYQDRFLHCVGRMNQVLRVTGPQRYAETVEAALTALEGAEVTVAKRINVPINNASEVFGGVQSPDQREPGQVTETSSEN
ncbi:hypothetical protein [uncultured Tateyamaria sp.]|uniref:hypothetical protein n=1 Tax=uncultured Tateyamaria sp. TaxID=455651 RepID=UPI002603370B|nr:hypothetical protein [uncultured Tateyamaria sp.]